MWTTGGTFELSGTIGQPDAAATMAGGSFELVGGFWPGAARSTLTGDLNCDGMITYADINPFVQILSNFGGWQAAHPGCPWQNGDCNQDGMITYADINPFVAILSGGG